MVASSFSSFNLFPLAFAIILRSTARLPMRFACRQFKLLGSNCLLRRMLELDGTCVSGVLRRMMLLVR